jgi:pyruvate/2-oxoacid:ferredoxin oxidoreductase alpha subunit
MLFSETKLEKRLEKKLRTLFAIKFTGKSSKNVVVCFGSAIGAVLDATKELDVKVVQILYIEPFALGVEKELKGNLILVENDSRGSLADLIKENTCFSVEIKTNFKI